MNAVARLAHAVVPNQHSPAREPRSADARRRARSGLTTSRPPGTSHPIGRLTLSLVLDRLDCQMSDFVDRRSKSLWMDVAVAPGATPLQGDTECDIVVIGAGVAGISTAYELAIEGSHVIVLDRG